MCLICVEEKARLKIQYAVIGEQLKAVKLKKAHLMLNFDGRRVSALPRFNRPSRCVKSSFVGGDSAKASSDGQ